MNVVKNISSSKGLARGGAFEQTVLRQQVQQIDKFIEEWNTVKFYMPKVKRLVS